MGFRDVGLATFCDRSLQHFDEGSVSESVNLPELRRSGAAPLCIDIELFRPCCMGLGFRSDTD